MGGDYDGDRISIRFQFLGIPPKGEQPPHDFLTRFGIEYNSFQFLGIPPKGEHGPGIPLKWLQSTGMFPISRDPPEGGTFYTQLN